MTVERDQFGQPVNPGELEYDLTMILEEVNDADANPNKSLLAYVADILERVEQG